MPNIYEQVKTAGNSKLENRKKIKIWKCQAIQNLKNGGKFKIKKAGNSKLENGGQFKILKWWKI